MEQCINDWSEELIDGNFRERFGSHLPQKSDQPCHTEKDDISENAISHEKSPFILRDDSL